MAAMNKCLTLMNKSLDGGEAIKKRPVVVWRQTGDDSKGIRDANRSKFIGYVYLLGFNFLGGDLFSGEIVRLRALGFSPRVHPNLSTRAIPIALNPQPERA